jgi:hypothetical protein
MLTHLSSTIAVRPQCYRVLGDGDTQGRLDLAPDYRMAALLRTWIDAGAMPDWLFARLDSPATAAGKE